MGVWRGGRLGATVGVCGPDGVAAERCIACRESGTISQCFLGSSRTSQGYPECTTRESRNKVAPFQEIKSHFPTQLASFHSLAPSLIRTSQSTPATKPSSKAPDVPFEAMLSLGITDTPTLVRCYRGFLGGQPHTAIHKPR